MAFRGVNFAHLARFNSAASSDFLRLYESHLEKQLLEEAAKPPSKNIAPSGLRCARLQWFRLRGVTPDTPKTVDTTSHFQAQIGTACHRIIQSNLVKALGDNWISVKDYLQKFPIPYEYELTEDEDSLETKVAITSPFHMHFACDGIIFLNGEYWLLEIKTAEYDSFDNLTDVKAIHREQIKTYATVLNLNRVLVLYQDRLYGKLKCYEMKVSTSERQAVLDRIDSIEIAVETNIAPDRLPTGDPWCSRSRCQFYESCRRWG